MKVKDKLQMNPTQDGDGVNITRIADFRHLKLDPFLMIDEIKSDQESDFVGGFPPHPHRGIETFTYMIKGGFEHKDQMGNKKHITQGNVQWMSTGSGVIHSEMPLVNEYKQMHGFQIWLNMPAKDKMRPAKYLDSSEQALPEISDETGANLRLLAGDWSFADQQQSSPIQGLAGGSALADLTLDANHQVVLDLSHYETVLAYVHTGAIVAEQHGNSVFKAGDLAVVDTSAVLELKAAMQGAGILLFAGNKIGEKIVHYGPFVMNSMAEIDQTIADYQNGKFGEIVV